MSSQTSEAPTTEKTELWRGLAAQLRIDSIRCTTAAGSGHALKTHLPPISLRSHVRRRIEVHRDPTADCARLRQRVELAPHDLLAEIHRDPFKDEESRPRCVEPMGRRRVC